MIDESAMIFFKSKYLKAEHATMSAPNKAKDNKNEAKKASEG
jgi:hypothetical protein